MRLAASEGNAAMRTTRQSATTSTAQLKDEIYRQMFRLEENRPGADMGLALALLRIWVTTSSGPETIQDVDWLRKLTPICLQMIEKSVASNPGEFRCAE